MTKLHERNRTVVLASLLALIVVGLARPASAQSLALAPAEVIATFTPGQPVRVEFSVSNSGNQPVAIRSTVTDLWYNEKNEKTFGPAGSSPRSAAPWIQFVPRLVTIAPNSSARLTAFITPPPDAEGGYYAVAFVESKPELAQQGTRDTQPVFANIRLGALLLLTADGTDRPELLLDDVRLSPPSESENLAVTVTATNHGNTHVFPKATLTVLDGERHVVAKAEADPRRFLPGQTETVRLNWSGRLPAGAYEGVLTVLYGKKQLQTKSLPFTVSQ